MENFNKEECKDEALLKLWEFLDFRTRDTMWQWKNKHLKPTYKLFCKFKDKKYFLSILNYLRNHILIFHNI